MTTKTKPAMDRAVVKLNIDRFIQLEAPLTVYVEVPPFSSVADILYAQHVLDHNLGYGKIIALREAIFPRPSTVVSGFNHLSMMRGCYRAEFQSDLVLSIGKSMLYLPTYWNGIRHYEENPEDEIKGWKRLFSPTCWFQTKKERFEQLFEEYLFEAYDWLQEQDLLKQRDQKVEFAIRGLHNLDQNNQKPTLTVKAPLDEFVAEQIRRVPPELFTKEREFKFYWVNGSRVVDFDCTFYELYQEQLKNI